LPNRKKKREILNELLFELDIIVFGTTISEVQEAASEIIARRYGNEILTIFEYWNSATY
jgi:hypothetical protein